MQDLWEPFLTRREGHHRLTSVEVTVTNRCNLRCRHCAVGDSLTLTEPERLPVDQIVRRLDEVEGLRTFSLTGGEPSESVATLNGFVLPLLRYAKERGLRTQVNTNLTFELERYERIAPYVDVFHITWNYPGVEDFQRIVWAQGREHVTLAASERLFQRIVANTRALAAQGYFISAETMINRETAAHLGSMNRFLADLGCRRHEVHPMYRTNWAAELPILTLDEFRAAVGNFLVERNPDLWVLFGTFPFFACSPLPEDQGILTAVREAPNVTVRNCPDGRNRLNINGFTGEIIVTDFAAIPPLGNILEDGLEAAFERWQQHELFRPYDCFCREAGCTGPNLLVAQMYYPGVRFGDRRAVC